MPQLFNNEDLNFWFFTFLYTCLAIFLMFAFLIGIVYLASGDERDFETGKITLQQYCETYKTSRNPPATCYNYFNVKAIGSTTTCTPTGMKNYPVNCTNTPILESK